MHFKIKFIDSSLALNSFLLVERNVGVWLLTHPSEPSLAGDPDSGHGRLAPPQNGNS